MMQVERLNLETNEKEKVDCIGIVQFIGHDKNADLTDGKNYYVIGFHQQLLKVIDDTQDYYYYIPFDANDIGQKEGIVSGFHIIEDPTGQIHELFASYKKDFDLKQKKRSQKLSQRLIQWKLKKIDEKESK